MINPSNKRRFYILTLGPLLGLVVGFGLGFLAHANSHPALQWLLAVAEPVGTLWINALRMIVIPFMLVLLIVAVASVSRGKTVGKLGSTALLVHVGLMVLGAGFAVTIFQFFIPAITPAPQLAETFAETGPVPAPQADASPSLVGWIEHLVPSNLFQAAVDEAIIPLIVVALLFGFALRQISEERKQLLLGVFRGLRETFEVLIRWVLAVMTVGVFAVSLSVGAQTGPGVLKNFLAFIGGLSLILLGFTLVLYVVMGVVGRGRIKTLARALWPAQVMAASTRSSLVCLPVLAESARKHLRIPEAVSGFVLPLSNSTFRLNRGLSTPLNFIFLAHFYGLPADAGTVALFVLAAVLTNFSSPGLPSAGLFTTAPLYLAAGIPLEGVVMLKAIDAIPDVFKTICNVTGDMTVLFLTDRWVRHESPVVPNQPVASGESMVPSEAVA